MSGLFFLCTGTYTEVLEVVNADGIAEKVEQSILEHASVAVAVGGGSAMAFSQSIAVK